LASCAVLTPSRQHPKSLVRAAGMEPVHAEGRWISCVKVVPYGVLGSSNTGLVAAEPDAETAFVDPAGLFYIQGDPSGAGGAAGVIYRWLGLTDRFPEPVREGITAPLQAKFHAYGERKCVHVVGPDLRARPYTRDEAVDELSEAYAAVLREFFSSGLRRLRLLPISGGIFSGFFADELPQLTAEALEAGFGKLDAEKQQWLRKEAQVEMCVFLDFELDGFTEAFGATGDSKL